MPQRPPSPSPLDVCESIRAWAGRHPDKTALLDGPRRLTFGGLAERAARVANGASHDFAGADRVGLLAYSCLEYVELVLGLAAAGRPAMLLNARLSAGELAAVCQDCALGVLFVQPALRDLAEAAAAIAEVRIIEIGADYEAWLSRASASPPPGSSRSTDTFCIAATGGTTGRSKGVVLSQRSRALMYGAMRDVFGCYGPEDRNLAVAPLFHGAGFNFCFASLYFGGSVVLLDRFDPQQVWRCLEHDGVTNASVVPTHLAAMLAEPCAVAGAQAVGALRALICNGAPLPLSTKQRGRSVWGEGVLCEAYGGTEAGIITTLSAEDLLEHPTSVGRAFPGVEIQLRDEAGAPVLPGVVGEVYTRSPYHFDGYVGGAPHAPDAWFSGGDLAVLDASGFLHLVDRKNETIISGGVNIYPAEVEMALADHPAVAEVAVFGVPDAYWGEAVHALVALAPGAQVSAEELRRFAAERVGRMKAPKSVAFRDSLPKSAAGKVLRRVLRDEHRARAIEGAGHGQ